MIIYIDPPLISEHQRNLEVVDLRHANKAEFAKVMAELESLLSRKEQEAEPPVQTPSNTHKKRFYNVWAQGLLKLWRSYPEELSVQIYLGSYMFLLLHTGQEVPQELLEQKATSFLVIKTDSVERNLSGLYEMRQIARESQTQEK